ncbi:asparagine synthase-related protein [Actinoallomurus sp. NPDC052308]|uniref:asparagine synthase-related protein n=1 Tax=Actinoallomurus sp. NPDC052308 TaxID=3155530 RepID=UPI00344994C9
MKEAWSMAPGFTVIRRSGKIQVQVAILHSGQPSSLTSWIRRDGDIAALMGSLYYKQDLISKIKSVSPALYENDADLALAAYQDMGMSALDLLEGDFALVIWDAKGRRLIGTRDPMGGYPLFWMNRPDRQLFSTEMSALAATQKPQRLNDEYFAEYLMALLPHEEEPREECAYAGIARVLPGTAVIMGVSGAEVERRKCFDWMSRIVDPGSDDPAEIAEQYRPMLTAATRERIHGRTMAHLSGGMDSTSISLLARDLIRSGAGEYPLHTLSLIYEKLPLLAEEQLYIDTILRGEENMCAHKIVADDMLFFDPFEDPPLCDEPYPGLVSFPIARCTTDAAAREGCLTVLTGIGSDEVHVIQPYYLADLLRSRRMLEAWRHVHIWAYECNSGPWGILQQYGIEPIASAWRIPLFHRRTEKRLSRQTDATIPPWVRPGFARRHDLRERTMEQLQRRYRRCSQTALSLAIDMVEQRAGDAVRWGVSAPLGIARSHPFLDPRVFALGLGIQARMRPAPGERKPVLAATMEGLLPEIIRRRKAGKVGFDEVYFLGLTRNEPTLQKLIRQAPGDVWEIFDPDIISSVLKQAGLVTATSRQLQRLDITLSLIIWLSIEKTHPLSSRRSRGVNVIDVSESPF